MNIFYLSHSPEQCAAMHNDKHTVKMVLEYAQLLSTAHRVLDGRRVVGLSKLNRKRTYYSLPDDRDGVLYSATHINHPSAVWVRQSYENYVWLHKLLHHLCKEYTLRYGKVHKVESSDLLHALYLPPDALNPTRGVISFSQPTPAMPDTYKVPGDSIASYRNYYNGGKQHLASWKVRGVPSWYTLQNA